MTRLEQIRSILELFTDNTPIYFPNLIRVKLYNRAHPEGTPVRILSPSDTIAYVQKTGKCLLRWGDAEPRLLLGGHLYYQHTSPEIRAKLREILHGYSDASPYLWCIPSKVKRTRADLARTGEAKNWESSKFIYGRYANKAAVYGDSLLFYSKQVNYTDARVLWQRYKALIVVHHDPAAYEQIQAAERGKQTSLIQVPDREGFALLDVVKRQIKDTFTKRKYSKQDCAIILSGGTLAKILVHDLSKEGYRLFDIGTLFGLSTLDKDPRLKDQPPAPIVRRSARGA